MKKTYNLEIIKKLVIKISEIGHKNRNIPPLKEVKPFKNFFDNKGNLKQEILDDIDDKWTIREILARYLLLNAVLDQGPDIIGVRNLLKEVTNTLYKKRIRIFHQPIVFFKELNLSIDEIIDKHNTIKKLRKTFWAKTNNTNPNKYNLFFSQSQRGIISIKQVLDYSINKWGVPLCFMILLEKNLSKGNKKTKQPLINYLESYESSEIMSKQLKNNERYGLGSTIGDKACHLFTKWYIHTFNLSSRKDSGWSKWSFEFPLDSNAGRVLFRTGFLTILADLKDYEKWNVIQKGKGKGKTHYLRVTNIRGKKIEYKRFDKDIIKNYQEVVLKHLKTRKKTPKKIEIQHIPNTLLLHTKYGVGDFDDGLIYIGTNFCHNHNKPNCKNCPLNNLCLGRNEKQDLITNYRT